MRLSLYWATELSVRPSICLSHSGPYNSRTEGPIDISNYRWKYSPSNVSLTAPLSGINSKLKVTGSRSGGGKGEGGRHATFPIIVSVFGNHCNLKQFDGLTQSDPMFYDISTALSRLQSGN